MMKENLKEVIVSQHNRPKLAKGLVKRFQADAAEAALKLPHAVVMSGIRRSGKSTLLMDLVQKHYHNNFYFLNFEDERLINFNVEDFQVLYEVFIELYGKKKTFYFDEIQNVPEWERFIRRMQDEGNKFFLTGSNASMLSKELGTKLTGRHISLELFPFSFTEYLDFKQFQYHKHYQYDTQERGLLKKHFSFYLKNGGMPEYLKFEDPTILVSTYEDILYRDIIIRHDIKDIKALREIGFYLLSNIASRYSLNKIKSMVDLGSVNTVKNYLQYFEDAYLFFPLEKFSFSVKQQVQAEKKIYIIDNGFSNAISFQFSSNLGKYLENLVFLELRAKGLEVYYYQTEKNNEVDFVIKEANSLVDLIQVAYDLHDEKTKKREITALLDAMEETGLREAKILTYDTKEVLEFKNKKIEILPVYQWLLSSSELNVIS